MSVHIWCTLAKKMAKTIIGRLGSRGETDFLGTDEMVGVERIELSTSCSQSRRPTSGLHPVHFEFTTLSYLIRSSIWVFGFVEVHKFG